MMSNASAKYMATAEFCGSAAVPGIFDIIDDVEIILWGGLSFLERPSPLFFFLQAKANGERNERNFLIAYMKRSIISKRVEELFF